MVNLKEYERKRLWPNFKIPFQHMPGATEKDKEKTQDSASKPGAPEYEAEALTTRPRRPMRETFFKMRVIH
jgi:hypothetical protein